MTEVLEHAPAGRKVGGEEKATAIDVSICIVTWNSERWIEGCLEAASRAAGRVSAELLVLDNASGDHTVQRASSATPRVRVVSLDQNHGFAGGVNRAIDLARGEYILLLNPDCRLDVESVAELKNFLDRNPKAAAAVPLLFDEEGEPQREFQLRRLPTVGSIAAELLLLDELAPTNRLTARYRYRELDITSPCRVEQPAAAAMMLRRAAIDRIGRFDERFAPAWFEDVDYCRRLREAGEEIWLVPSARAVHRGGASLEQLSFASFTEIWYRNLNRYARKWMRPRQVELLRWLVIAGMFLRIAALTIGVPRRHVTRRAAMRAYRKVMKQAFERWGETSQSF